MREQTRPTAVREFPFSECLQHVAAHEIMRYGVISIEKTASASEAAATLIERKLSGLPVTHEGALVGVLSNKDLLPLLFEAEYLPGCVEDYMTPDAVHFEVDSPVLEICHYMVRQSFRRVPILHDGTLSGIITRADLIRAYRQRTRGPQSGSASPVSLAEDVMCQDLLTVGPEASIDEAMDLMLAHHVTGLPVVDPTKVLLGIVTEKDILLHLCNPDDAGSTCADIMTPDLVTFGPHDTVDAVCACLIKHSVHRVPVVLEGRLVGLISRSDVLAHRCAVLRR